MLMRMTGKCRECGSKMVYYCSARGGGAPVRRCPKCGKVQEMRHNEEGNSRDEDLGQ